MVIGIKNKLNENEFLKLVLPAFAILMAVGLAFATEDQVVVQDAHYYIPGQGWETIQVDDACYQGGSNPCKFNGMQLYAERDLGSTPLSRP